MTVNKSNTIHTVYLALPFLLVLGLLVSSIYPISAQENDINVGDITFVRLANGEPGGEGIYTINADGSDERPLFLFEDIGLPYDQDNGGYRCPVWSPDGRQLALNGTEGETNYIAVVDVDSGDVQRVYEVQHDDQILHNIYFPEWVPNTSQLSFGFLDADRFTGRVFANGIRTVSLDSGDVHTLRDDIGLSEDATDLYIGGPVPNFVPFSHSWSASGDQVAVALYNWRTYLINGDGSELRELAFQWVNGDVEWSPDDSLLADSLYRLTLINLDDDTERELVPIGESLNGSTVESLAWSPDGSEIAYSTMWIDIIGGEFTTAFSLSVVDVESGEIRELVRTPSFTDNYPYNISCVDWHPTSEN